MVVCVLLKVHQLLIRYLLLYRHTELLSIKQNRNIAGTLPSELGSMTLLSK